MTKELVSTLVSEGARLSPVGSKEKVLGRFFLLRSLWESLGISGPTVEGLPFETPG